MILSEMKAVVMDDEMRERIKKQIRLRDVKYTGKVIDVPMTDKFVHYIETGLEVIDIVIKRRNANKNWWQRWGKRVVRFIESIVLIAGYYCVRKEFS